MWWTVTFEGPCSDQWEPGFVKLVPGVVDVAPTPRASAQGEDSDQRGLRKREGRLAAPWARRPALRLH